jgi:hypothetical protein
MAFPPAIAPSPTFYDIARATLQNQSASWHDIYKALINGVTWDSGGGTANYLRADGTWDAPPGTTGTVTSVGLADGSATPIYAITGSPVTISGTLTFTLKTEAANLVFAGPTSGAAAQPTFRALVAADVPSSILPGGFTGFANPTALVGLTAINGVATTAMRSDAAPALNQAIAPTWTGFHTWTPSPAGGAIQVNGNAGTGAYALNITGAAASGAQDLLLVGYAGVSNGLTVKYDGTQMQYGTLNGQVNIGAATSGITLTVGGATTINGNLQVNGLLRNDLGAAGISFVTTGTGGNWQITCSSAGAYAYNSGGNNIGFMRGDGATQALVVANSTGQVTVAASASGDDLDVSSWMKFTEAGNLPASSSGGQLQFASGGGSPFSARTFIGDGTGWEWALSKRATSANTDLVLFKDSGTLLTVNGACAFNGELTVTTTWPQLQLTTAAAGEQVGFQTSQSGQVSWAWYQSASADTWNIWNSTHGTCGTIAGAGNWTLNAPSAGVDLTLNGLTGSPTLACNSTGAAAAFGIGWAVSVVGAWNVYAQSTDQLALGTTGAQPTIIITNGSQRIVTGSAGNVTVNAATSGVTATINGLSTSATLSLASTGAAAGLGFGWAVGLSATSWDIYSQSTDPLAIGTAGAANCYLYTNALIRMSFTSTGAGTVNAPTSGTALTVNAAASSNAIVAVQASGGTPAISIQSVNGVSASLQLFQSSQGNWQLYNPASTTDFRLFNGSSDRITVTTAGNTTFAAPSSGNGVTVNGCASANTLLVQTSGLAAGTSYGLEVEAGTNASDYCALFASQGGGAVFCEMFGDGHGFIGVNSTHNLQWNNAGGFTFTAPAAGQYCLTVDGVSGSYIATFNAPNVLNNSFGVLINAGTSASDYCFRLFNNNQTTEFLRVAGSGTIQYLSAPSTTLPANMYIDASHVIYSTTSARRFKKDIRTLKARKAREVVQHLRPVTFRSRCELDDPNRDIYGLIAEEVAEVDPTLVHLDAEGRPSGVQYERLACLMLPLLQELLHGERTAPG